MSWTEKVLSETRSTTVPPICYLILPGGRQRILVGDQEAYQIDIMSPAEAVRRAVEWVSEGRPLAATVLFETVAACARETAESGCEGVVR